MKKKTNRVRFKGKLKAFMQTSIYLGILLLLVDILLFIINIPSGVILLGYLAMYFAIVIVMYNYNKTSMMRELINFATHYGQIQKALLQELDIPYALLDDEGHILWMNDRFMDVTHKEKGYIKSITSIFPSVTREKFPGENENSDVDIEFENSSFQVKMRKLTMKETINNNPLLDFDNKEGYLIAMYLFDNTTIKIALQEIDDQSLAVGMIYIDNYEEALESVEEVRRSLLIALIDRKINKYITALDGICKKLEKDKYMVILRKKALGVLSENKFDLLDDVKTVNIGNEMAVTVSIGVGLNGLTYSQNYEFARNAIDLALGRGGDQAVVKTPQNITYYGGKSQQVEKNTRVKARVKAQALQEIISSKERVLVMGHRLADVDSFGSAVGVYSIARSLDREAHIVIGDMTNAIKPMVDLFDHHEEYPEDMMIDSSAAIEMADGNTVLVIVDVNRPSITECPELLHICKSIVVLDHHRQGTERIENATLSYVEAYASSACEMVSEILQYIGDGVHISNEEADCMYSGMMIDTNNFMTKTGVRTFEAAAFLRRNGADVTRVRKLFREDVRENKAKSAAVSRAEIYRDAFAISAIYDSSDLDSPTVVGAQAANELLNIKGVKASFVMVEFNNQIFISARSIDEVNVQVIMEKMGGGGHLSIAGTQLSNATFDSAKNKLIETLEDMIQGGELKL